MLGIVSYWCEIVTLSLRRAVFPILDFKNAVTLKTGLGDRQGHWKCHHSIECIRIDPSPTTSYECSILTMGLSRTVSEIDGDLPTSVQNRKFFLPPCI